MAYMEDIEQLNNNIETQNLEIKKKKKEIEACESGRMHIESQAKSLSQKVMANYLVRMKNQDLARGYYTWLENTREKN